MTNGNYYYNHHSFNFALKGTMKQTQNKSTRLIFIIVIAIASFFISFYASAQNLGVNTSSPTNTLDVNGTLRVRGGSPGAGKVLVSDASGITSWKNRRIAFRAKGIESQGAAQLANNSWYPLLFLEESYDYGNNFNLAPTGADRNKFIVPVTGVYHFSAATAFGNTSNFIPYSSVAMRLQITRDGQTSSYTYRSQNYDAGIDFPSIQMNDDIRLLAGDKIWIEVRQINESGINMPMGIDVSVVHFACHLMFEE